MASETPKDQKALKDAYEVAGQALAQINALPVAIPLDLLSKMHYVRAVLREQLPEPPELILSSYVAVGQVVDDE